MYNLSLFAGKNLLNKFVIDDCSLCSNQLYMFLLIHI